MRPSLLLHPADETGCGYARMRLPAKTLAGGPVRLVEYVLESTSYIFGERLADLNPSHILVQRQFEPIQINAFQVYKAFGKAVTMYEIDDLLWNVPHFNGFNKHFTDLNKQVLKDFLYSVDKVVASTEPLAEEIAKVFGRTASILPNMIDNQLYRMPRPRDTSKKLRVCWAGSPTHHDDLLALKDAIRETRDLIDWHFVGYVPPFLEGKVTQHPYAKVDQYLNFLDSLQFDVGLAPLYPHRFNECKSNIKLLEFGAIGLPVITSDIYPYKDNPGFKVSHHLPRKWKDHLLAYAQDEDMRFEHALKTYSYASSFNVQSNVHTIFDAWSLGEHKPSYSYLRSQHHYL